jgi:hypothetical protein
MKSLTYAELVLGAATAMNFEIERDDRFDILRIHRPDGSRNVGYDPIQYDTDAFELMTALGINVYRRSNLNGTFIVADQWEGLAMFEATQIGEDPHAAEIGVTIWGAREATRLSITKVAHGLSKSRQFMERYKAVHRHPASTSGGVLDGTQFPVGM